MALLLEKLKRLAARGHRFEPARLGPDWDLPVPDRVAVKSGPLAGRSFGLAVELTPRKADFYLFEGSPGPVSRPDRPPETDAGIIAHTHFERDPETGLETEWNIFVRPDYRGKGLSSLIVRLSYRRLLAQGGRRWFAMRKLMQVDSRRRELQNIGIGLIGVRLGLRPEPALEGILAPANVRSVQLIEGDNGNPPGLFIELRHLPGVVVAAEFGPDTVRPVADPDHYRRLVNPAELARSARSGRAIIGNIDYTLAAEHLEHFCRHFADTPAEYRAWLSALRSGAKKQET